MKKIKEEIKEKTLIEIWKDDLKEIHFIKISTEVKNIPDVIHRAINLLKKELEI